MPKIPKIEVFKGNSDQSFSQWIYKLAIPEVFVEEKNKNINFAV